MDTQEFIKKWTTIAEQHFRVDKSEIGKFNLGSAAYDFLFLTGIPSEFQDLNFDYLKEGKLKTVNQKLKLDNSDFDKYLSIGFNGSGDPISIDLDTQELIYLNHDNNFEVVFINSDLKKFAVSVLRIKDFVEKLKKLNPNSFFETEFSDEELNQLIQDLKRIDPNIFESKDSHWKHLIENYKWERDEERSTAANNT
ncbi:MAG: SUKH-4 family immunity protein [Bacteroidota bacterium]